MRAIAPHSTSYNKENFKHKPMTNPATALTAGTIANLAFQKFLEVGAGKLADKFSDGAIAKMTILLQKIWAKLHGRTRVDALKDSIHKTGKITQEQVKQIVPYLQIAMDEDPHFADEVKHLAVEIQHEIHSH
jgi:hypothetical protein